MTITINARPYTWPDIAAHAATVSPQARQSWLAVAKSAFDFGDEPTLARLLNQ